MPSFARLPFEEQLIRIARAVDEGDAESMIAPASELTDPEPLARLLEALAEADPVDDGWLEAAERALATSSDPALSHVFAHAERGSKLDGYLVRVAQTALESWPTSRPSALAFLVRWLRRRDPEAYEALRERARRETEGAPTDRRWLLFVDGARLARLRLDEAWAPLVEQTVAEAVDALARAPKSISQVNAERLLARRVYADPGHFLFELLQNADDAGARAWSARIERRQVRIDNDGAPFSFLDLVGVLSIGQTTKAARQIGFFGVGFKSVYEVCDRPRIHSGAFDVEIAHVSIPRVITRPRDHRADRTGLVLPFRPDVDVDAIVAHAARIPPETLMTLPNLQSLVLASPGAVSHWTEESREGETTLRAGPQEGTPGEARRYWRTEREVRFAGAREEGRPDASRVLVAARVDGEGAPTSAPHPTLFAFLPTGERTGLRVLVHARFDVTLDRERLELGSPWNEALLRAAGEGLADLVLRATLGGWSPLPLMTAPADASETVRPMMSAARTALVQRPCLPGADGTWITPARGRMMSGDLAHALRALDLGGGTRALLPLDPREAAVAVWLGARAFVDEDLLTLASTRLSEGAAAPDWLGRAVTTALGDAAVDDARLRALPLVPDSAGRLRRAVDARLAPLSWARLYEGLRAVVSACSFEALPETLRDRLAVVELEQSTLEDDLRGDHASALLGREPLLLDALTEASPEVLDSLRDVAVLRGADGGRWAVSDGLVRPASWLSEVAPSLVGAVPIVAREVCASHADLVQRWVPTFGLSDLVDALEKGLTLEPDARTILAAVLDRRASQIGRALARRLARIALFADHAGTLRPLAGDGRAVWTSEPDLDKHLPGWPWLADPARAFVTALEPSPVGPAEVASALVGEGPPIPSDALEVVLGWLTGRAGELSGAAVDALADAPVWLDLDGAPRRLEGLRRGEGEGAVARWYAAVGGRAVAHPTTVALLRALRIEDRLPASDHAALVEDLLRAPELPPVDRALLCEVLEEAAHAVSPDALAPLADRPMWEDEHGTLRRLVPWSRGDVEACHRAGPFRVALRAGSRPLLSEADELRLPSVLAIVGPRSATVGDLVEVAPELTSSPDALLDAVATHAEALTDDGRAQLAALPLFASRSGARRAARALCDPGVFLDALGPARVEALGMDDGWLSDEAREQVARLGLSSRPPVSLHQEAVLPGLTVGAPLDEQVAPWRDRESLWALCGLHRALGLALTSAPLALDAGGRVRAGPLGVASAAARRLGRALPFADQLADEAWAAGPVEELLTPLPAARIAEALRVACPEERPRKSHPIVADVEALYAWLREEAETLTADATARGAIGKASVIPSQRGTLRAPREMVLDPGLPDLGLDWGLAADVPDDVGRILAALFELDKSARRTIVDHTLDGIDAAEREDDRGRAAELVRFLAGALGAGVVDAGTLEQRARRSKARARLRVPVEGGGWEKPRFAWAPSDEIAEHAIELTDALPPRIALPSMDGPTRRLLTACGARSDLDEETVDALLRGEGLREGRAARRALARYVAVRALESRARIDAWKLHRRAWVPDRVDGLHPPRELLWPDELAEELFGGDAGRFPDAELCFDLSEADGERLGFGRAHALSLDEVAKRVGEREARVGLLEWLEEGLRDGRFEGADVLRVLGGRLRLRDDAGEVRPVAELAQSGANELFGPFRGDLGAPLAIPRLAAALNIPPRPDAPMIVSFLAEVGAQVGQLSATEEAELVLRLPLCLERLAELASQGVGVSLPSGAAVASIEGGRGRVVRLGDPALRLLEPVDLAEALSDSAAGRWLDPLPTFDRGPAMLRILWGAGVPDLWSAFRPRDLTPGPARVELDDAAEALRASLARVLKDTAGRRARVVDGLVASGVIELPAGDDYRSSPGIEATVELDALVLDGTLWLTPDALRAPALIAPALALDPVRRAATAKWLEEGRYQKAPRRVTRSEEPERREGEGAGLWSRLKRIFSSGDEDEDEEPKSPRAPSRSADKRTPDQPVGEGFFRPQGEISPQLEGSDGWVDERRVPPDFGFAFSPARVPAPWLYAPKLIATRFDRRGQRWRPASLRRPDMPRNEVGVVSMRGTLPRGDALLPIPLYGRLAEARASDGDPRVVTGPSGGTVLRLERAAEVRLRLSLGAVPDLDRARGIDEVEPRTPFVPDEELPDEVHDFLAELDLELPAVRRALAVRDFVRERYRYDPSYLEDAAVGRWLAKITRGRANAHVAALHAASDARHLGAGVCYELNVLACELMRRAEVPSAIATGWLLDGGSLSEPDHLWAIALLVDDAGEPAWVPIDASTTRDGRPLRVPRRPAGRFKKPREKEGRAPKPTRWDLDARGAAGRGGGGRGGRSRKARRPPRAELHRLLNYLERVTNRALDPAERAEVERALVDKRAAAALLARLSGRRG